MIDVSLNATSKAGVPKEKPSIFSKNDDCNNIAIERRIMEERKQKSSSENRQSVCGGTLVQKKLAIESSSED